MIRANPEHGYILLPVVILLVLVASVAFMINHESALDSGITSSQLDAKQAEYVARAGLNHALWQTREQGCGPYTDLTNQPFDTHSYTTTLTSGLGSTSSYTIAVDQDTWIRSDQPTDNKASDSALHIRFEAGIIERPMYRYNLSPIAAGSNILSATAWFYVSKEHPEGPVDIHLLNDDWTETSATWDSMGDKMDPAVQATIPSQPVAGVWVAVNLTSQVQAWVNGLPNLGITLTSVSEGTHGDYASNEAGQQPYLAVIVGTVPSTPTKLQSKGKLTSGITRTINLHQLGLYQQPSHIMLQPGGADGKDAWLTADKTTWNYGNFGLLRTRAGGGGHWRSPIQFNLDRLPRGAQIRSATLELYRISGTQDAAGLINIHAITDSWIEGDNSGGTGPGVTWDLRDLGQPWATTGGDFDVTPSATIQIDASADTWFSTDVTSLVQQWVNGSRENYGMMLVAGDSTVRAEFSSSDEADPTLRPKLTIRYACECGSPCIAPQGTGRIALIGDDSTPDPDDQLKIGIIESWGYLVDFYEDQDSDNISWSNYDLAYVSETSISGDVDADLTVLSIGVVNEEPKHYDDLELASGDTEHVGSIIDITDNSHFITSIFPLGPMSIYNGDMEILTANTPLAGGLQVLGEYNGNASLTALEQGASTTSGTAAGRRVTLPLGQHFAAGFDWTQLNHNGHLLVQRAIAWGMGADKLSSGKQLLLVVANDSNPTNQEEVRKTLIESWGYAVSLIDDSDSQANFDAAAADNDVVLVSGTVSASALGTKLKNATLGVVNEQLDLHDEFGFSLDDDTNAYDQISVTDNTHEITTGFSIGWLTIATSSEPLQALKGDLAPGLETLAETWLGGGNYKAGLALLDSGDELYGGGNAAGRRVQLPWGGSGFDFSKLNDDGKTIMQRAIDWAGGVPGPKPPIAHWKFDETTGTTAVDSAGGHDGALTNGPLWTGGQLDGALNLDGSNDHIAVPHNDALSLTGNMSFSAWINANAFGSGYRTIVTKDSGAGSGSNYYFGTWEDELVFGFSAGAFRKVVTTGVDFQEDIWYHVAATFNSVTDQVNLYVNGALVHNDSLSFTPSVVDADLTIGRSSDDEYWHGRLDDVRIYDQPLSTGDIADIAVPPDRFPVAHWQLDETAGTTAVDVVGGHDGTLVNGPVWTSGQQAGGLAFDGNNDKIDVGNDTALDNLFAGGATISAWIRASTWGESNSGRIADKADDVGANRNGWSFEVDGGQRALRFEYGFSTAIGSWYTPLDSISLDSWHHVAVVYDRNSAVNDPVIYIDGIAQTSVEQVTPAGTPSSDSGINLTLGNHAMDTSRTFDGVLDDIRVYDLMLDASEVAALAAGGGGGPGPGGCNGTFLDAFDTESWSGSNGTLDWSASPWGEVGETDGAGNGDVMVLNDLSNSRLRIRDNQNGGEGVERVADLDGAATATLSLDYRRQALDNSNDYVAVYLSTNGTAGPWDEIVRFQGGDDDAVYQPYSQDISGYISAQTAIRLRSSPNMGNNDIVWFDNIQIECQP